MNLPSSWKLVCGGLLASCAPIRSAEPFQFVSGETRTALLELYTSEGCSSCPPAEGWFSRLRRSPGLWKDFVPVAFHVDYWDDLGWKDPFATEAYSKRQKDYASQWHGTSVYTPAFVLAGREWRGWARRDELPPPSKRLAGVLSAISQDGWQWNLRFAPSPEKVLPSCQFHAAFLGFDRISAVKSGENSGRSLQHDFVVLELVGAAATKAGNSFQATLSLKANRRASPGRTALAAWVTRHDTLEPLQAVGGWLSTDGY